MALAERPAPWAPIEPTREAELAALLRERDIDGLYVLDPASIPTSWLLAAKREGVRVLVRASDAYFACPRHDAVRAASTPCSPLPRVLDDCHLCLFGRTPASQTQEDAEEPERTASEYATLARRRSQLRQALRAVDGVVLSTPCQRDTLVRLGAPADTLRILPRGIAHVPPRAARTPDSELRLGYIGTLERGSGLGGLLRAIAGSLLRLERAGMGDRLALKVHLDRACPQDCSELQRLLERTAARFPQVVIAEPLESVEWPAALAALDALLIPAQGPAPERLLRVAQAVGVPVVAVRRPEIAELVTEGVDGLAWDTGDTASLQRLLCELAEDATALHALQPELPAEATVTWEAGGIAALYRGWLSERPPSSSSSSARRR